LARDQKGIYYYVDALRESDYGLRLYVGRQGAMKLLKLKELVSDSEGDIFFTARGKLRIDGDYYARSRRATWIRGKRREELLVLPPGQNLELIYKKLGVYKGVRFGTPCDDLAGR
jgi:hypothetical protein